MEGSNANTGDHGIHSKTHHSGWPRTGSSVTESLVAESPGPDETRFWDLKSIDLVPFRLCSAFLGCRGSLTYVLYTYNGGISVLLVYCRGSLEWDIKIYAYCARPFVSESGL